MTYFSKWNSEPSFRKLVTLSDASFGQQLPERSNAMEIKKHDIERNPYEHSKRFYAKNP